MLVAQELLKKKIFRPWAGMLLLLWTVLGLLGGALMVILIDGGA